MEEGQQMVYLFLHLIGSCHGVGDLLFENFPIALLHAVGGHARGAVGDVEALRDLGVIAI